MQRGVFFGLALALSGCGVAYVSPSIRDSGADNVRVIPLTAETVLAANRSAYDPRALPDAFSTVVGGNAQARGAGALPEPVFGPEPRPRAIGMNLPPELPERPYRIGVGDVVLLATPQGDTSAEALAGLLAAQNRREGYTVQDDGAITIPDIGRIAIAGLTLAEAEDAVFQRLVDSRVDPTFSIEVSEFNSSRVSIGGAVGTPAVVPITLTPLYLDEALAQVGGVQMRDPDFGVVRIYRGGSLYQVPVSELFTDAGLRRIRLLDGDSIYVDTAYDLDLAQAYFEEQIRISDLRRDGRIQAMQELQTAIQTQEATLSQVRSNFESQLEYGQIRRDYVYLTGEVEKQGRFPLPFGNTAYLADALFENGGLPTISADASQIYVLRGSSNPMDFASITALHLDASNAANFLLATRLEMRPNDVIFVAEHAVTRWNRVLSQITPSFGLLDTAAGIAN